METLKFGEHTFFVERIWYDGEYGSYANTNFYLELKTKLVKKYVFFGPLIEVPDYKPVFTLDCDIKDKRITKSELREKIQKKVDLMNREQEIARGEYI